MLCQTQYRVPTQLHRADFPPHPLGVYGVPSFVSSKLRRICDLIFYLRYSVVH